MKLKDTVICPLKELKMIQARKSEANCTMHVYPSRMLDRHVSNIMLYLGLMAMQATTELFICYFLQKRFVEGFPSALKI